MPAEPFEDETSLVGVISGGPDLAAENDEMVRRLDAVRHLHSPRMFYAEGGYTYRTCSEDNQAWPCATIDAIVPSEEPPF